MVKVTLISFMQSSTQEKKILPVGTGGKIGENFLLVKFLAVYAVAKLKNIVSSNFLANVPP